MMRIVAAVALTLFLAASALAQVERPHRDRAVEALFQGVEHCAYYANVKLILQPNGGIIVQGARQQRFAWDKCMAERGYSTSASANP